MDSDQQIRIDVKLEKVIFDIKIQNNPNLLNDQDRTKLSQLLDFYMNFYLKCSFDNIKENLIKHSLSKGLSVQTPEYLTSDQVNDFQLFQNKINKLLMKIAIKKHYKI